MNKICSFIVLASVAGSVSAQTKPATKPKTATTAKPATTAQAPVFKTSADSLSYCIAMSTALYFKEKGATNINPAMASKAFEDVIKKDKPAFTQEQMNQVIITYLQNLEKVKADETRRAGTAFLEANKAKPGVVTLPSGLQYQIVTQGTGPKPAATDRVKVHYRGTLIDGTVFDSSIDRGEPAEFPVNGVIAGWTEALQLMPVGSKWKLFIPSNLAYGDRDAGQAIKGGSTLLFDVELLSIENQDSTPKADSTQQK
ncbi:FKBP-type peptidyl-prolyl cis-trans isomerase [Danxiaibacter flavus]|uniref:Peptidyl-prolyl cis-trans isomerase n=1 Tax=Danxiaibacter flavus TaxID=3049108 RepID=A0ABV3ZF57_9BACT|nr:FKBP-type peptidyl-prolyl cis-trans isomerase [Chitinophagaceae bacterium DXS]